VTAKGQDRVKAIVQDRFGPPDVLRLADTGLPEAGPDDVLVRMHAAAPVRHRPTRDPPSPAMMPEACRYGRSGRRAAARIKAWRWSCGARRAG